METDVTHSFQETRKDFASICEASEWKPRQANSFNSSRVMGFASICEASEWKPAWKSTRQIARSPLLPSVKRLNGNTVYQRLRLKPL